MNKNSLWSQPNVARKASNSDTLHSGYDRHVVKLQHTVSTWPLNFADGMTAQFMMLDFRVGYATAFSGDPELVGNAKGGRHV